MRSQVVPGDGLFSVDQDAGLATGAALEAGIVLLPIDDDWLDVRPIARDVVL